MKLLTELKVCPNYSKKDIFLAIKKKYFLFEEEIEKFEIVKESIDSRHKPQIFVSLNIAVEVKKTALKKVLKCSDILVDKTGINVQKIKFNGKNPVVVGFGPSGMFCALTLAKAGLNPIVIEQGKNVFDRQKDVDEFWKNGKLNETSNVQFGEGGAGTFSDGKLISNVSNEYTKKVINEFILAGAPNEIFYSFAPHIGSDKLKDVVVNIRKQIEKLGGKVIFNAKFEGFELNENKIYKVNYFDIENSTKKTIETDDLILAVGHSAVDVYRFLNQKQCEMVTKPFAMGVRIEQLQSDINLSQYGNSGENIAPANYKLAVHLDSGRSVFTFCMCPGGYVVASSSDNGTIVTNGMSEYARDNSNANSAVLVNVEPEDYGENDVLAGVEFQHKYEKLAYTLAGGKYYAPCEMVKDFLDENDNPSDKWGKVKPSFRPGVTAVNLKKCLPDFVFDSIKEALPLFAKKISHFADDENLLIGVETRSSAPVQIVRNDNFEATFDGLYVCGEGAGYAGGITSSGQDGIKCALKIIEKYK